MALKIVLFYGSVRSERQGIRAARFVQKALLSRGHEVVFVDPLEYDFPLLDKMYKELKENAPERMAYLAREILSSDAVVVVSGEYNHSIPPALSNLLDHYLEEYFWKPSAIVSYSVGGFGGVRAAVQLRAMLAELGMPSIPSMFPVSKVHEAFSEQGDDLTGEYNKRIQRFIDELEWYARALKNERFKGTPY